MGLCSSMNNEKSKSSRNIDKELSKLKRDLTSEIKVLLLGAGESGKSTVFKQMKLLSAKEKSEEAFDDIAKDLYKSRIRNSTVEQMQILVKAAQSLNLSFLPENEEAALEILKIQESESNKFGPNLTEMAERMKALWKDPAIQASFQQKDKICQVNDSAEFFFDIIDTLADENYKPTIDHILRVRIRTTGIEEAFISFRKLDFRMIDMGGQRSERRKWIHCFDSVTSVIFCASMNEYDQVLREDSSINRMKESMCLFESLTNSPWFWDTPFIIFLNKFDLFKEKIKKVNLDVCFKTYVDGLNSEKASEFIKKRYLIKNKAPHNIYVHYTVAIDTQNIELVFQDVRHQIIKKKLIQGGLINDPADFV